MRDREINLQRLWETFRGIASLETPRPSIARYRLGILYCPSPQINFDVSYTSFWMLRGTEASSRSFISWLNIRRRERLLHRTDRYPL